MITVRPAGDAALLLDPGGQPTTTGAAMAGRATAAAAIAAAVRAAAPPAVIDIVPGARTVLVTFDPDRSAASDLAGLVSQLAEAASAAAPGRSPDQARPASTAGSASRETCWIQVSYDGPDLAEVAALTGLSIEQVIARHQAAEYRVGWLGFSPGFGYLTGLDPVLAAVPRLDSPRLRVPAGSVAIAGGLAAVYPAASPGGWRLLGRTTASLWDAERDPPALLAPGMAVRFRAVRPAAAWPAPADGAEPGGHPVTPAAADSAEPAAAPGRRFIEIVQPGPLTTIQDLGRAGLAHLGVPGSGAADRASLLLANELVGNDQAAAALEITLGRLTIRFGSAATIAITGAAVPIRLESAAAAPGSAFRVEAGTVLRLGAPPDGLRSYLAVDGGFEVPPVLGSRSADLLSGLGPSPLRAGELVRLGPARSRPDEAEPLPQLPRAPRLAAAEVVTLRAIRGPRDEWFTPAALVAFTAGRYTVSPASNRAGLRLTGPVLARRGPDELASEGVATGSLQVSHDGQPILLLADHPTTGGYPVIAVLVAADLPLAAQLRPGQQVRFTLVEPPKGS